MLEFLKRQNKIKKHAPLAQITQEAISHQSALDKSVAFVGPSKVGKSVLSKNYAKRHDLLYVNVSEAMRCDMDLEKLKSVYNFYKDELMGLQLTNYRPSIEKRFLAYAEISAFNYKFRLGFRKLKNINSLGYSFALYNLLKTLDPTCASLYYKKYENQFVKNLIASINQPCVLDMTHTVSANYDEEFVLARKNAIEKYHKAPEKYDGLTNYLIQTNTTIEDVLEYSSTEFISLCNAISEVGTTIALEYPNTSTTLSHYDQSKKIANNKVIVSNPTIPVVEEIVIRYSKTRCEQFEQTYNVINKTCINEMMDIVDSFVSDKFPEILENKKQLIPSF